MGSSVVLYRGGDIISGTSEVVGNTLTFTPDTNLHGGSQHRLDVRYRVPDFAGLTRWNGDVYFTTAENEDLIPPQVIAISPDSDGVDADPKASVVLSFDEPMMTSTINNQTKGHCKF